MLDTEDKRFYEHNGVDLITLTKSAIDLVLHRGEITRGGSTITMQLPRNLGTFSLDQLFIRKFKEILLALKIERELSKDEILELYINAVPFGKRAYGAQAAAYTYYGKPLTELNLSQLAMLAGIPQAPTAGNPINGPERALVRRGVVLSNMLEQHSISQEQYRQAVAAPISARLHGRDLDLEAPYPAEWVRQELVDRIPDLYSGGYEVITTLDSKRQQAARDAVRKGLAAYDRRHGYRGPEAHVDGGQRSDYLAALAKTEDYQDLQAAVVTAVAGDHASAVLRNGDDIRLDMASIGWARPYLTVNARGAAPQHPSDVLAVGDLIRVRREVVPAPAQASAADTPPDAPVYRWVLTQTPRIEGALVSLDPHNGAVRALVGGYDFALNQYDQALQAARQPGSGFKPFVYSAALANGVTASSIYMDAPLVFNDQNLESEYRPDNDDNRYNGPTRLRVALYKSINLVTMRVLLDVGADKVLDFARRFGFDTSQFPHNTQLAVGGGTMAVTPIQMARAYAVFANGGYLVQPHILNAVYDLDGNRVLQAVHPEVCDTCESGIEPIDLATLPVSRRRQTPTSEPGVPPTADGVAAVTMVPGGATAGTAAPSAGTADDPVQPLGVIPAQRVLDPRIAYIMHTMLQDVIRHGTGRRARALERSDLAGKTGTTNEAADTWFNGYNPDLVATVWVGFPDHTPLGAHEYGATTPLPIWMDYMKSALAGKPENIPAQPPGVVTMKIDPSTGKLAPAGDPDAVFEYFLAEHTPAPADDDTLDHGDAQGDEIKPVEIF